MIWVHAASSASARSGLRCGWDQVSKEAGAAATAAKGSYGCGIGEEWMAWLPVAWGLREFIEAMEAGGQPKPNAVIKRPDGQLVIDAFPLGCAEV